MQFLRYKYAKSVRWYPNNTRVVNCFPSFLITWITSSSSSICLTPLRLNFFKCWQLSTIRRTVSPLNPCGKENISFTSTKTVLKVVLITVHYTYNCIKLMHNKEVFYTHFAVLLTLSSQQCRQAMYVSCNNEVHLCNHCCSRKAQTFTYSKSVCL